MFFQRRAKIYTNKTSRGMRRTFSERHFHSSIASGFSKCKQITTQMEYKLQSK
jgi:hypothetical protein